MNLLRRLLLSLALIAVVLAGTGCEALSAQFRSPSERFRLEGDRLIEEGRTAEAILSYRAAYDNDHGNLAALRSLAELYAGQGRRRLALRLLDEGLTRSPQDAALRQLSDKIKNAPPSSPALNPKWSVFLGQSEPVGFSAGSGRLFASLEDGTILSVDPTRGAVLWTAHLPDKATSAPGFYDERLWVGAQDGVLYVLSAADGKLLWKFGTKAPVYAVPVHTAAAAFVASGDGTLYALDPATGSLKWSFTTGAALHAQPTLYNDRIYFGSNDGRLYALEAASGASVWGPGIQTQGAVESPVVFNEERVYFGSGDARVYSLSAATGGEYWRYSAPDAIYAPPLIQGSTLFAASAGKLLVALDKLSGKKLWEYRSKTALNYPLLLAQDRLLLVSPGSSLLTALDPQTGAQAFALDTGDWLAAAPQADAGLIFLLGKDGTLLAWTPPQ